MEHECGRSCVLQGMPFPEPRLQQAVSRAASFLACSSCFCLKTVGDARRKKIRKKPYPKHWLLVPVNGFQSGYVSGSV